MTSTPKQGGARKGAGRPAKQDADKLKNRTIRMTEVDYAKYLSMGGNKWLLSIIRDIDKTYLT